MDWDGIRLEDKSLTRIILEYLRGEIIAFQLRGRQKLKENQLSYFIQKGQYEKAEGCLCSYMDSAWKLMKENSQEKGPPWSKDPNPIAIVMAGDPCFLHRVVRFDANGRRGKEVKIGYYWLAFDILNGGEIEKLARYGRNERR